jgi:hypothetical protein
MGVRITRAQRDPTSLAGLHALDASMFELASGYAREAMTEEAQL